MPTPTSHHEAVASLRAEYESDLASGNALPFVYPIASFGAGVGLLFSLIPPTSRYHNPFTRYVVFLFIACWHAYIVASCKGLNPSTSFGIGCIATFGTLWSAVLLVFNDAKASFKRINDNLSEGGRVGAGKHVESDGKAIQSNGLSRASVAMPPSKLHWQGYPSHFGLSRVCWLLDMWTNFRLMGWNYKPTGMPSSPEDVQKQLQEIDKKDSPVVDEPITRAGLRRYDNSRTLLIHSFWLFLKGYILLDVVMTLTHYDPYFRGEIDAAPPQALPTFMKAYPGFWIRSYRLIACMTFVWLGLRTILVLAPLIFVGIFGKRWLGVWGEPWLYPDHYGSYAMVYERGLAGWWGGWWHQSFRFVFQSSSDWIANKLGMSKRSTARKTVTIFTSFFLSGVMHASGSVTQQGPTQPLKGPMLFFLVQPAGLLAETFYHSTLRKMGLSNRSPKWLQYTVNIIWVHAWFWLTAPLLVDDMAKGGLWLIEPAPFSPMRALGFGTPDDRFFCWSGPTARWHRGESWISSGLAL